MWEWVIRERKRGRGGQKRGGSDVIATHCSPRSPIMDDCPLKPLTLHSIRPPINYEHSTNACLAFITIQSELLHLCSREENQRTAWVIVVFDSLMLPDLGFFTRASASGTVWTLDGSCVALWRAAWLLLHVPNVCASQTTFPSLLYPFAFCLKKELVKVYFQVFHMTLIWKHQLELEHDITLD